MSRAGRRPLDEVGSVATASDSDVPPGWWSGWSCVELQSRRKERAAMRKGLIVLAGMALGFIAMSGTASATAPNAVKNGSFEEPVVGSGTFLLFSTGQTFDQWKVIGASGNVAVVSGKFTQGGFSFPAKSGNQWLDLTGESNTATGVTQTVPTGSGTTYSLTFSVGNVYDPTGIFGTTSSVDVLVDGTRVLKATNSQRSTTQVWQEFETHFTAKSKTTDIAFINADPSSDTSNGLDAINLEAVPVAQTSDPASYVPTPTQISWSVHTVAESWFWVALLMVLLGAASTLFNSTLDANFAEIQGWFAPVRRRISRKAAARERGEPVSWEGWRGLSIYVLLAGLVYTLRSPSLVTFADFAIGIGAGSLVATEITRRRMAKRLGKVGHPIALPFTLLIAGAFMLISAIASARPGYVFGIIIGVTFVPALEESETGAYSALEAVFVLGIGLVAWFLRWPLSYGLSTHPDTIHRFVADLLAVIVVSCVCAVAFGMAPLRFLPGEKVHAWHQVAWAALWALGLFALLQILESGYGYASAADERTPTLVFGIVLLAFSIAFWAYFRRKGGELKPTGPNAQESEPVANSPKDAPEPGGEDGQ